MTIQERIYAFIELGKDIEHLREEERYSLALQAKSANSWFTYENVQLALKSITDYLRQDSLLQWLSNYDLSVTNSKKVGLVMAGHTPAEGFHDCMCILLSGHILLAKQGPPDSIILKKIAALLTDISPELAERIIFSDRLNEASALIATVNDRTAVQFNRYFSHIPHIIRQPTKSCAILNGDETASELLCLGNDMLQYFGLGNGSVSKVYVPQGYSFDSFFRNIEPWHTITDHHKYVNNYDYNKSILLVNAEPYQDNGFLLLHENESLVSPVAVVHYQFYTDADELAQKIEAHRIKLQSIVSQKGWFPRSIAFGHTSRPAISEYAGGIDTMQFLTSLV
jgi:hypothetical protein